MPSSISCVLSSGQAVSESRFSVHPVIAVFWCMVHLHDSEATWDAVRTLIVRSLWWFATACSWEEFRSFCERHSCENPCCHPLYCCREYSRAEIDARF